MRCDAGRERHLQSAPRLPVFLPGCEFLTHETLAGQQKRGRKVIPVGVPDEVGEVQIVPRGAVCMTGKRCAWLVACCQYLPVETFDSDAIRPISGAAVRRSEAWEPKKLTPGAPVYDDVLEGVGFALARQQGAVNRHAGAKAAQLAPQLRATV